MYIDVYHTLSFNIKLAHICGLNAAVYLACLQEIAIKVVKKSTLDDAGFFKLDREYVTKMTSLTVDQQYECDNILSALNIIGLDSVDKDHISLNLENMLSLILEDDAKKLRNIELVSKSKTKAGQKESKRSKIISNMVSWVSESITNQEVVKAYATWVEAIYDKFGAQTRANVVLFRSKIEAATTNINQQVKILEVAASCQYREAEWAIKKVLGTNYDFSVNSAPQKQFTGVNTTTLF